MQVSNTVKLGDKERFDREQLVLKNHFPWPIVNLLHKDKEFLAWRNNFRVTKKFLITKFDRKIWQVKQKWKNFQTKKLQNVTRLQWN